MTDSTPKTICNALTIDLEEYFHADNLKECWPPERWEDAPRRARELVPRLLETLADHGVTGTWFVLGWLAEREPELLREVARAGHEIGCHGYAHRLIYEQSPQEFAADLQRATAVLQDVTGVRPTAFRAPSFSITRRSWWALDVLRENGYEVDSSIFPVARSFYGVPDFPREPVRLENGLIEFPLTVIEKAGRAVPVAGGGYCRLLPNRLARRWLRQVNRAGRPVVFYCHPWEFDRAEPPGRFTSPVKRFRHQVGRASLRPLLESLLREMRWGTVSEVAKQYVGQK